MKHLLVGLLAISLGMSGTAAERDTVAAVLREVVVSSSKENMPLREQALSSSAFGQNALRERGVASVKDLTGLVPGLFIPSYGSRLTTSVYLRGVGSRTGTPAVGLYIDGVPQVMGASFDVDMSDVERIEVLRGPQSTLYGRGTMGGLLRVTTKDPLKYEGSDITLGAATYNAYKLSATHYHRLSPRFGFMGGVSYRHDGGFFRNTFLHKRADKSDDLGARLRFVGRPSDRVRLDLTATYEYSRQGAYPYRGDEGIAANRLSKYDRHLLNLGLTAEHTWERVVLSNVLAFQYLDDEMNMDQDFTSQDIYTLRQRQRSRTLSEEVVVKSRPKAWAHWQMTTGAAVFYQWLTTSAPVTFQSDGLAWLNRMINQQANAHMPQVVSGPMTMDFHFADTIQGRALPFAGRFTTPTASAAIYHQSTLTDLFNVEGLSATLGLRLDYEKMRLRYACDYAFDHAYELSGHLTSPFMERDIVMVPRETFSLAEALAGRLRHDYLQLLPKVAVQYAWGHGRNVYATVSRGYRSGGYNIQMFSEVMQSRMRGAMMRDVNGATVPVLENQPMVPAETKEEVKGILNALAQTAGGVGETLYKPEYAWNYEVGTHQTYFDGRLALDAAAFWSEVRDQQVSRMVASGLGRITANIGRSRSVGCEVSAQARLTDGLSLHTAYGFTHATLRNYYRGNYVPFTPRHTFDVGARYEWHLKAWLQRIALSTNYHALGRIYWTEQNNLSQPFYGTLDARLTLAHEALQLSLYATNITCQRYDAFRFETMGRTFAQRGRPMQAGVEVRVHF